LARTAVLGFPRIGADRELKFALESYWAGTSSAQELFAVARAIRAQNWQRARDAGIDVIPCGDFSLYDHVLDHIWALGAIPRRFGAIDRNELDDYFVLARGDESRKPLEMTKWLDTNYHYLVPELEPDQQFDLRADRWIKSMEEAAAVGVKARPVVLGPFSFLKLAKGLKRPLDLLERLTPVYVDLMRRLAAVGAEEVQLDEPCLVLDLEPGEIDAFSDSFEAIKRAGPRVALTTYFAGLDHDGLLERLLAAEPWELHIDLVRAPRQLESALRLASDSGARLSVGVIDGRNVWAADLDAALARIGAASKILGSDRVTIAPSCSLMHLPWSAAGEREIDPEIRPWLAFSQERIEELALLGRCAATDTATREQLLAEPRAIQSARRTSTHTNNPTVRARVGALRERDFLRSEPAPARRAAQHARVPLPELPTTTIGSFPQTPEIRAARRGLKSGTLTESDYIEEISAEIRRVVDFQERLDIDVLVHGEAERNDMVEYFGEQLDGFTFSTGGWVQSYGSRCVKPPILYGDVARPEAMTVEWWRRAQAMTTKPMKGMLTGPVTILQWSFVRDDQPREETCRQIALAIQDEVVDLEAAGCFAIQVDEAALREGRPLQRADQDAYNRWAIDCFGLTVAPAAPDTQIHTHMCYSEFNEMMDHIIRLDADVISIEASRSAMDVLDAFAEREYPNDIGPGVYDIHSQRIPAVDEIVELLALAEERIGRERLWVNPDCGLKTRSWAEVEPALANMVAAAEQRRAAVAIGR
jgi:5-methyltetrahydropteroyltriglutamate--homocysteine methyltransferase